MAMCVCGKQLETMNNGYTRPCKRCTASIKDKLETLTARVSELEAWKARFKGTTLGYYDVSEEEWEKMRAANERTNDGSV